MIARLTLPFVQVVDPLMTVNERFSFCQLGLDEAGWSAIVCEASTGQPAPPAPQVPRTRSSMRSTTIEALLPPVSCAKTEPSSDVVGSNEKPCGVRTHPSQSWQAVKSWQGSRLRPRRG